VLPVIEPTWFTEKEPSSTHRLSSHTLPALAAGGTVNVAVVADKVGGTSNPDAKDDGIEVAATPADAPTMTDAAKAILPSNLKCRSHSRPAGRP
jgi:hypothetical protein